MAYNSAILNIPVKRQKKIMLVGRTREQAIIAAAIFKKKNLFVYGKDGVGKTFIVKQTLDHFDDENIFYSEKASSLKNALLGLLKYAYGDPCLCRQNTLTLKRLFYKMVKGRKPYLILDHVGRVSPRFHSFLEYLINREIPLMIVGRGTDRKEIGHLVMSLLHFEKVEISDLNRPAAEALTGYWIKEFNLKVTEDSEFKKKIFHFSKGHPKTIKELCSLAGDVKYHKNSGWDVRLMDLDRRIREIGYS